MKQAKHKIIGDQVFIETIQIGGIQIIKNRMLYLFIGQAIRYLWVKPYYNGCKDIYSLKWQTSPSTSTWKNFKLWYGRWGMSSNWNDTCQILGILLFRNILQKKQEPGMDAEWKYLIPPFLSKSPLFPSNNLISNSYLLFPGNIYALVKHKGTSFF